MDDSANPQGEPASPQGWDRPYPEEPEDESIAGPLAMASLASVLLGAALALGVLAWLNDGKLEFQVAGMPTDASGEMVEAGVSAFGGLQTDGSAGDAAGAAALRAKVDALEVQVRQLEERLARQRDGAAMDTGTEAAVATPEATEVMGDPTPTLAILAPAPTAAPAEQETDTATAVASSTATRRATSTATPVRRTAATATGAAGPGATPRQATAPPPTDPPPTVAPTVMASPTAAAATDEPAPRPSPTLRIIRP